MKKKALLAATTIALGCVTTLASAGPPHGGGRHVGPHPGGAYRPYYPAVRPVYPGWRTGYWGPRAGVYIGAPAYWGGWPYAWGGAYAAPYALSYSVPSAVAPLVVNAAPAPQVIVQAAPAVPADSYWYYCTQPAGYFPYVQNCSQPWMRVVPQVPGSSNSPPQLAP
ncbi:MAG: hypothetical protein MUF16_07885 [Burkholderiaceae bacterium]|jgi:hypothetical protein|nr:hypothetical protein [Burkholderiaceae bacterium]